MVKILFTSLALAGVLLCGMIVMIVSKPSDLECISILRGGGDTVDQLISGIAINKYTVRIEYHLFYKNIYSALDNHKLGTAIFGTVIKS